MQRIPEPLKELVEQMARLPGLGPKSAMRAAMTLLKWPEAETRRLGRNLYELRDKFFDYVVSVASGEQVKSEKAGFHDMAIFKQGVIC